MVSSAVPKATNPFTPTFGHVPFALAGRTEYIDDVIGGLANRPGDPNRSTVFIGPRGSGKTVLLTAISRIASEQGWICVNVSARDGMLEELLWQTQANAAHLLAPIPTSDIVAAQAGPIGVTREMRRETYSWRMRMSALIEELNQQGVGLLFTVDEVNPNCVEFGDFIDAYQHFMREERDVALLVAGLPNRVSALLLDESVSFIRRAFQRPLGPIPQVEVEQALLETIEGNGRTIDDEALAIAAEATQGFAFAIQLIGYYLWRQSSSSQKLQRSNPQHHETQNQERTGETITPENALRAIDLAGREMERSVFVPTLRELRPREVQYLRAMAQDDGASTTSDIARRMGISMTNASNLRRRLLEHGSMSEVRMGLVDFEMPMLREYLRTS